MYNVSKHLERCVQSLKEQNYSNLEIIFVDDKSTDNSLELLKQLTADMPNVKIIEHETNQGLLKARLTGLLNCTGDYIHFLDSDDFVDIDFYASYIEKLNQEKPDICFCRYHRVDKYMNPIITMNNCKEFCVYGKNYECLTEVFNTQLYSAYHYMWTKIISKELWEKSKQDLLEITKDAVHILGGEESIFNIVFLSKAYKVTNCNGKKVSYCQHDDQSIKLTNFDKLMFQTKSIIRANTIARNYAIQNNIYQL